MLGLVPMVGALRRQHIQAAARQAGLAQRRNFAPVMSAGGTCAGDICAWAGADPADVHDSVWCGRSLPSTGCAACGGGISDGARLRPTLWRLHGATA